MSDSRTVLDEANALASAGTPSEAVRVLVAWTNQHPDDAAAWELLAKVHFDQGHWLPARMAAVQVAQLRPESALAWCNLGTILRKMEKLKEAGEAQRRALQLDPNLKRAKVEIAKLQKAAEAKSGEATAEAGPEFPPVEPDAADSQTPYYCRQCRRKIPRAVSDENEGLCGTCLREQPSPESLVAQGPQLVGIPVWAVGAALVVLLVFGTTIGLVVGRRGHQPQVAPTAAEGTPSATDTQPPRQTRTTRSNASGGQSRARQSRTRDAAPTPAQASAPASSRHSAPSTTPSRTTGQTSSPQTTSVQLDPREKTLLQTIESAQSASRLHQERERKYRKDADYLEAIGDISGGRQWSKAALAEGYAAIDALQTRDQARFDLAKYYLTRNRSAEAVALLKMVEESQTGTTQLGAAARSELSRLGEW